MMSCIKVMTCEIQPLTHLWLCEDVVPALCQLKAFTGYRLEAARFGHGGLVSQPKVYQGISGEKEQ